MEVNGNPFKTDNNIGEEIRRRVTISSRSYYSLQKPFRSETINRNDDNLKREITERLVAPALENLSCLKGEFKQNRKCSWVGSESVVGERSESAGEKEIRFEENDNGSQSQ